MAVFASKTDIQFLISKIKSALSGKVDTVSGKGLSTNDYTTAEKNKLAGIAAGANAYTLPTASASILGGVKVGSNLTISNGVLSGTPNTTYSAMTGASASAAGSSGLVPAPSAGAATRYLRSDGTWVTPPDTNTTYSVATASSNGLMSAADKSKLDSSPTASSIKSQIEAYGYQTSSQVQTAVNNAVGKITGISLSVVTSLPTTGAAGTIYLIAHSHSDSNDGYDEYIWVEANKAFEKIGNTDVDLSAYMKTSDLSEIGTTDLTTMWNA